jgi:hypothetical protein
MKMLAALVYAGALWAASASSADLKIRVLSAAPAISTEIARGSQAAGICGSPSGRGPVKYSACIDRMISEIPHPVGGSSAFELGVNYSSFRIIDITLEAYRQSAPRGLVAEDLAARGAIDFARIQLLQGNLGLTDLQVCEAASTRQCQDIPALLARWR